ncbi:MAG: MXAN_5187 C-terminal domain-containing protein [Myxococcota bacterium]
MRLKIILGNLVIVLLVGLGAFWMVRSQLQASLSARVDERIEHDRVLFDRSWRLSAVDFLGHVSDRARTQDVTVVFGALDEDTRRQRAHRAANSVSRWFMDPARGRQGGPDVVAITDEAGRVIARDKDINRMHDQDLSRALPTVRDALREGSVQHDVWWFRDENKLLQTGVAPILNAAGATVGSLVVGYELSNGLARREAEVLGREVAFLYDDQIYSASVSSDLIDPLEKALFGPLQQSSAQALEGGRASAPWSASLNGDRSYIGVAAPLPSSPSASVAYVVMADRAAQAELVSATDVILLLTFLGAVGVLIYGWVMAGAFLRPLERIEEDVLRVINGRTDVRIDVESAEFGGLAYRINQLINVFTGVAEEDAEGRVSQGPPGGEGGGGAWQGSAFAESRAGGAGGSSSAGGGGEPLDDQAAAAELEAEPAEQYYERLHREYVAAKQAAGEDVSGIPKERFLQRIQGNEQALAQKHGVRMVRFRVEEGGQLRPVLIR